MKKTINTLKRLCRRNDEFSYAGTMAAGFAAVGLPFVLLTSLTPRIGFGSAIAISAAALTAFCLFGALLRRLQKR